MGRIYVHQSEPVRREPPPKRAMLLAFIRAEIDAGRDFPTPAQIRAYMGWLTPQSARHALEALACDGQIKRIRGKHCVSWELIP